MVTNSTAKFGLNNVVKISLNEEPDENIAITERSQMQSNRFNPQMTGMNTLQGGGIENLYY